MCKRKLHSGGKGCGSFAYLFTLIFFSYISVEIKGSFSLVLITRLT